MSNPRKNLSATGKALIQKERSFVRNTACTFPNRSFNDSLLFFFLTLQLSYLASSALASSAGLVTGS